MWLNLVALAILGVFVALGAKRGALTTGLGIATILLSYAAAVTLGPAIAPAVDERLAVGPLLALPLASSLAFLGTYMAMGLVSSIARRLAVSDDADRSPLDRIFGAAFGGVRGLLVAFLLVYLAMWLDALRATGNTALIPQVEGSAAAALTSEVVERAVGTALDGDDPASRVTARLAARPAVAAVELQAVIDDPSFTAVRSDSAFWTYVEAGNVDAAMNRRSFRNLQHDAQVRHRLANLALVPDEAASDPAQFRAAVGEVLREVGPRIRDLRNDPELQALMQDPEVMAMVQSGNTMGLLAHPRFRAVVAKVTAQRDESPAQAGGAPASAR